MIAREQFDERSSRRLSQRGQAMPSAVAVVSVVAIVVAMVAFFAGGSDDPVSQEASSAQSTSAPGAGTDDGAAAGANAGTAAEVDEKAGAAKTAARTPNREKAERTKGSKRDERDRGKQQRRDRPEPQTGPPDVYVEVYNNTTISGLAAATAAELQDAGWQVVGVDNWHGDIPASTIYYPAGLESEAQQLAETLGFARVRGAVAPMKFDRLTVILTPDAA